MKRREFITLLGGTTAAWPLIAHAQQATMPSIGVLVGFAEGEPEGERWVEALLDGLSQFGWKPGKNLRFDLRWGANDLDRIRKLAHELVASEPNLIQAMTTVATAAVLQETHTIPIAFSNVSDPVGSGFVQSLSHPDGNATGFVNMEDSMGGKWLELLKKISSSTSRVLIVFNPRTAPQSYYYLKSLEPAAASLAITLTVVTVSAAGEIKTAITDLANLPNGGLVITPDSFTVARAQRDLIISLAARERIPVVYSSTLFVKAGGLISYGTDYSDVQRRAAAYVDRILIGGKPENLPVQLPTKFELAVNLKTAKALSLTIPTTLLATADEVIE